MRKRWILTATVILALAAGAGGLARGEQEQPTPIADADLGLSKGSVFEVPSPPVPAVNEADPGDLPPVARAFPDAPPRVPHAVADFLPITRRENWCVDCHALDWTAPREDEPTPIPESHYRDLRAAPETVGDEVAGARWVCVSCHLPVTAAPPLVASSFGD